MWQVKDALLKKKLFVYPNVIKVYTHRMGLTISSTRKVINASVPVKCEQRLKDAIEADKVFDDFYDRWNQNLDERLYFYDQSSMSQYKLQDDKVITEPGLVIYEVERPTQNSISVTFHCIVDQYMASCCIMMLPPGVPRNLTSRRS